MVQWLRLCTSPAGGTGSILGWGSSSCHMMWPKKTKRTKVCPGGKSEGIWVGHCSGLNCVSPKICMFKF